MSGRETHFNFPPSFRVTVGAFQARHTSTPARGVRVKISVYPDTTCLIATEAVVKIILFKKSCILEWGCIEPEQHSLPVTVFWCSRGSFGKNLVPFAAEVTPRKNSNSEKKP